MNYYFFENDLIKYWRMLSEFSKEEISVQFAVSVIISLVFAAVMSRIIKAQNDFNDHKRILIGCSFLISVIYNSFSAYIYLPAVSLYLQLLIRVVVLLILITALCLTEWLMLCKNINDKDLLKKFLIKQGILLFVLSLVCNIVAKFIILFMQLILG